jgi:hypothetical protein
MSAGALHRFKHGCPVPTQTTTPHSGPLFDELFRRQAITLSHGEGERIWDWQRRPDLPHEHTPESLRHLQKAQWELLKSNIDAGKPAILCLIREEGYVAPIWKNHQVLAVGYEYEPTPRNLTVEVYDCNDKNHTPNFLYLCLSGGRLGAYQLDSARSRIKLRAFFVMTTTDEASQDHM